MGIEVIGNRGYDWTTKLYKKVCSFIISSGSFKEMEALIEHGLLRYSFSVGCVTFSVAVHVLVFIHRFLNI
jgi:hypothetical protein